MDGSHLQPIVVQHTEEDIPPLRHVHQFFQTLQSHCSHDRLTVIHLHQLFDYDLIGPKEDLFTLQSMELAFQMPRGVENTYSCRTTHP